MCMSDSEEIRNVHVHINTLSIAHNVQLVKGELYRKIFGSVEMISLRAIFNGILLPSLFKTCSGE